MTVQTSAMTKRGAHLKGISQTALLPLWGRVHASRMDEPLMGVSGDKGILHDLDYDFSVLEGRQSSLSGQFLSLLLGARARELDWQVRSFLLVHTHGTVVNVGAGLDDLFSRTDNGLATWYDIDTEEIVELRRDLLDSVRSPRVHELAGSVLDPAILAQIAAPAEGILFVFAGVLMYFDEKEVALLIRLLSQYFGSQPGGTQVVFDSLTPFGARIADTLLLRSGMQEAPIRWSVKALRTMERFESRPRLMESYPLFSKTSGSSQWGMRLKVLVRTVDKLDAYRLSRFMLSPGSPIDFDGVSQ